MVAAVHLFGNLQIRSLLWDQLFQRNVAKHVVVLSKLILSDGFACLKTLCRPEKKAPAVYIEEFV